MTQTNTVMTAASYDVEKIRADFPILNQQINGHPLVFLDTAASAQKPDQVIKAMDDYYFTNHANVHRGVHTLSQRATQDYEAAREKVRIFINAQSNKEVIFVRGATEAINLVASSYARTHLGRGDEVLITHMEHHANIVPWQLICDQTGASLKVAAVNDSGELLMDDFNAKLNNNTKIAAFGHISNALGTINPIKQMIAAAHAVGAVTLVDGAQAVNHTQVDVQALDCDFYTFSGHKLYGPTGIGVLYGKQALLDAMPPYQSGGEMIRLVSFEKTTFAPLPAKFEAGTPDIAGAIGLGAAIDYLQAIGLDQIAAHEHDLLEYATGLANQIDEMTLIGTAKNKAGILSFVIKGIHPHDLGTILDSQGVAVRTGHHCAQPLMQRFNVPATARASLGIYNTYADIDGLFKAIHKAIEMFK